MKKKCICQICRKEFFLYPSDIKQGRGRFCSHKCKGNWMSKNIIGKNHPSWKEKIKRICETCKKQFEATPSEVKYGWGKFCSLKCKRLAFRGTNNHFWKGGLSLKPYTTDWTQTLKRSIRERDHYICQLCNNYGNVVHHIDYHKENCNPINLITLCNSCNIKVNFNREYWKNYFREKICLKN